MRTHVRQGVYLPEMIGRTDGHFAPSESLPIMRRIRESSCPRTAACHAAEGTASPWYSGGCQAEFKGTRRQEKTCDRKTTTRIFFFSFFSFFRILVFAHPIKPPFKVTSCASRVRRIFSRRSLISLSNQKKTRTRVLRRTSTARNSRQTR